MMKHCKRIWNNYYIIKMDVSKYFQNTNKEILLNILKRSIKDKKVMNLINKILYSNKQLKSIPIGNYTSQMFANIYLNEVDQYIKNELKVKCYSGYKINEYRLKIRKKGKQKLKKKVKELKYKVKIGDISGKETKKYIAGHLGYIKIANTYNIEKKLFEI